MFTNLDKIKTLTLDKIADMLINMDYEEIWGRDVDGDSCIVGYKFYYITSDNQIFHNRSSALAHEMNWLTMRYEE